MKTKRLNNFKKKTNFGIEKKSSRERESFVDRLWSNGICHIGVTHSQKPSTASEHTENDSPGHYRRRIWLDKEVLAHMTFQIGYVPSLRVFHSAFSDISQSASLAV